MNISDWLDEKEAQGLDVSHIALPESLARSEDPEETIYFKETRTCGILCTRDHPFATVERFGHWFYSRGRDKDNKGRHTTQPQWWLFTKDKDFAVQTAKITY